LKTEVPISERVSTLESDLNNLVTSKTDTEKVYDAFWRRYRRFWDDAGSGMREHDIVELWEEWIREAEGLEHVKKFSNFAEPVDYLLERINEPGFDRVVIRDPGHRGDFIILNRDFADKVLVLGDVP
jgi:hypothetical protein